MACQSDAVGAVRDQMPKNRVMGQEGPSHHSCGSGFGGGALLMGVTIGDASEVLDWNRCERILLRWHDPLLNFTAPICRDKLLFR